MEPDHSSPELGSHAHTEASQAEADAPDPIMSNVSFWLSVLVDEIDTFEGLLSCIKYVVSLERLDSRENGTIVSVRAKLKVPRTKVVYVQLLAERLPEILWWKTRLRSGPM